MGIVKILICIIFQKNLAAKGGIYTPFPHSIRSGLRPLPLAHSIWETRFSL